MRISRDVPLLPVLLTLLAEARTNYYILRGNMRQIEQKKKTRFCEKETKNVGP